MTRTKKTFDAVTESRRWKQAVARQTTGMTRAEVLVFFDKAQVLAALEQANEPSLVLREDSSKS